MDNCRWAYYYRHFSKQYDIDPFEVIARLNKILPIYVHKCAYCSGFCILSDSVKYILNFGCGVLAMNFFMNVSDYIWEYIQSCELPM